MIRLTKWILPALLGLLLSACEEDIGKQTSRLSSFVEDHRVGEYGDFWLEQQSPISGKWSKVVLLFGFVDDWDACQELIELYKPIDELPYRCVPAN